MKETKNKKQGISLIVLVITIIVMIILAATVIISLSNNGIIGKANEAVQKTNLELAKNVAMLAWSETYMDIMEDRPVTESDITILTNAIKTALTNNKIEPNDYKITVTLTGVTVEEKSEEEWVEILSTPVTTEEGVAFISEDNIFVDGYIYRITIEGSEYNGQYICKAMYSGTMDEGEKDYSLMDIGSVGQPIWETYAELFENQDSINFVALGIYLKGVGCVIGFEGITEAHTITKIEAIKPKVVYKNESKTATPEKIEIEGLDMQRHYVIEVEVEGTKYYTDRYGVMPNAGLFGGISDEPCTMYVSDVVIALQYNGCILSKPLTDNVIVTAVYDMGNSPAGIIYENGFCLVEMEMSIITGEQIEGELIATPGGEYTIPETIGGVKVQRISRGVLGGGIATLTHNVYIDGSDMTYPATLIIKKTADQMLNESYEFYINDTIDVTDFGDEVVLPELWLDDVTLTVIVTPNAKSNLYSTNTNVVAAN